MRAHPPLVLAAAATSHRTRLSSTVAASGIGVGHASEAGPAAAAQCPHRAWARLSHAP